MEPGHSLSLALWKFRGIVVVGYRPLIGLNVSKRSRKVDVSKDYYAVLGVLPSIDADALKAVHRALLKKYHPDVFAGAKEEADRVSKALNEAYNVLGNAQLRREYDQARVSRGGGAGHFSNQPDFGKADFVLDKEQLEAWTYACRYFPDVKKEFEYLLKLSPALAVTYQLTIVTKKAASKALEIRVAMQREFLLRYFGTNTTIHEFVLESLLENRRDIAVEINLAIAATGSPVGLANALTLIEVATLTKGYKLKKGYKKRTESSHEEDKTIYFNNWEYVVYIGIGLFMLLAILRSIEILGAQR